MGPGDLSQVLAPLEARSDPRILVGRETFDDAGVFRIDDGLAPYDYKVEDEPQFNVLALPAGTVPPKL